MISTRPASQPARLTVLETHRPPGAFLKFVDQTVGVSDSGICFIFSQGLWTRHDVDVIHTTEASLGGLIGSRSLSGLPRLIATLVFATRLRCTGVALVRTLPPTGRKSPARWTDRLVNLVLDRATTAFIAVEESTPSPATSRTTVIETPNFGDRFTGYPKAETVRNRALLIVTTDASIGSETFLALLGANRSPEVELRYAGHTQPEVRRAIMEALVDAPDATARFDNMSDGARLQEIDSAEVVILPRIETLEEVQLALIVLSRERPLLTPRTPLSARIAETARGGWVLLSEGSITADEVAATMLRLHRRARQLPSLVARKSVEATNRAYADALSAAAERRGRGKARCQRARVSRL